METNHNTMYQLACESSRNTWHLRKTHPQSHIGALTLLLLLLLALPTTVQAQFTYSTNNGALTIMGYTGSGGDLTIPDTIDGLPVTAIGSWAFFGCRDLTSIIIPDGVTTLGSGAFQSCHNLTNVTLGNSLTNIEPLTFMFCSNLTAITIPNRVAGIGENAFLFNTGLKNVTISDSVQRIGRYAFGWCASLTNAIMGNGLTNLVEGAFLQCRNLTVLTLPKSLTTIGVDVFYGCTNLTGLFFQGNAPTAGGFAQSDPKVVMYYLPGATGWNNTLSGRPTKLWNPIAQASGPGLGVGNGQFVFNITGTADIPIVIEACTDLTHAEWQPLQSCTLTNGSIYFGDPAWTSYSTRVYRIRSP